MHQRQKCHPPPTDRVDPALIDAVQRYIDSSKAQVVQEKWTRALAGLGGASHANPMTAQEAQVNAYKFDPDRWNPVVHAMAALQNVTVDKPAALISAVYDYAVETHAGNTHVDRWNRVLAALGALEEYENPMTSQEAQTYADRGWKRWVPVVEVLAAMEAQVPTADHTQRYAELITAVRGYATETHHGPDHIERWTRVLAALGVAQHDSIMTAAEAFQMAEKYQKARWAPVAEALAQIESEAPVQQQEEPTPQQAPQDPQSDQQQEPPIWHTPLQDEDLGPTQNSHEPYQVPQSLITAVQGYAAETQNGAEHVDRWNRVLAAFGVVQHDSIMTAAEAQGFADRFSGDRWDPVVAALIALEESQQPHGMTRAEVIAEWGPKVQKMREMSTQANSMVNEAKEFVKKWDETPTRYADAIDNAERDLVFLEIRLVDNAYEQLKDSPTSTVHRETLQGLYESMQDNFSSLETHLELILNTARQPTTQEQCNQDHMDCTWHTNPHGSPTTVETMTITRPEYENEEMSKIEITSWPHGEIKSYTEYWASDPNQIKTEIIYKDPHISGNRYNNWVGDIMPGEFKFNIDTKITYPDRTTTVSYGNTTTATYNDTVIIHPKKSSFTYSHDTTLTFTGSNRVAGQFENGTKFSFAPNTPLTFPAGTKVMYDAKTYAALANKTTVSYYNNDKTTVTYSKQSNGQPQTLITYHEGSTIIVPDSSFTIQFKQDFIDLWIDGTRAAPLAERAYYTNGQNAFNTLYMNQFFSTEPIIDIKTAWRTDGTKVSWISFDRNVANELASTSYYHPNGEIKFYQLRSNAPICYDTDGTSVVTCTKVHSTPEY